MTWGELKEQAEEQGITDDTEVYASYSDITERVLDVNIDSEGDLILLIL